MEENLTMEEIQRCPVCNDKFQSTPMMLQCQHSMCEKPCLRTLKESSSEQLICPVCKKPHVISKDGNPKINITLEKVLDLYRPYATTIKKHISNPNEQFYSDEYLKVSLDEKAPCNKCRTSKKLKSCFHCGRQVCTDCKESHLEEVRDGILTFSAFVREVCFRLKDIQIKFSDVLSYNHDFADNIKPIFQFVLQLEHDMKPYFESIEIEFGNDVKPAEDVLLQLLEAGENHLVKLTEIEINPLIVRAKSELEKHGILFTDSTSQARHTNQEFKGNSLRSQINQTHSRSQADAPPVPPRSSSVSVQVVAASVQSNAPGKTGGRSRSSNQAIAGAPLDDNVYEDIENPGNRRINLSIVIAGCVVTALIAIAKIGIASWSLAEDTGTLRKVAGSFLIMKCLFETAFVFSKALTSCNRWWTKTWYVLVTVAVVFGCFLIIDTVLAYLPEGDISMAGKALQIVVITDWIWTVLFLVAVSYVTRLAK